MRAHMSHRAVSQQSTATAFKRGVAVQDGGEGSGSAAGFDSAARFSDAPSWEALEALVHARRQELGWHPPDLEAVRGPSCQSKLACQPVVPCVVLPQLL